MRAIQVSRIEQELDNNINNHSPLHTKSALDFWYHQISMDERESTSHRFIFSIG